MQKIPLNKAKEGMKLAKPVTRSNGMIVAAEGMELTESLIERLLNMKIERITVMGRPLDMGGASLDAIFARKAERTEHLFRNWQDDKWMMGLKKFFKEYFELKAAFHAAPEEDEEGENGENGEDRDEG